MSGRKSIAERKKMVSERTHETSAMFFPHDY